MQTPIGLSLQRALNKMSGTVKAGASMGEIVAQVQRVSQMISELSNASTEQSAGIGQVGDAVSLLDQVTQQNAALVEQSAAAAESLSQQEIDWERGLPTACAIPRAAALQPAPSSTTSPGPPCTPRLR